MSVSEKHRPAFVTAIWMIVTPLVCAFLAGAGAGTVFNGLAQLLGTMFAIFGGASLILGVWLMAWVLWQGWRSGDFIRGSENHG